MAENYNGMAVGIFELDSFAACSVIHSDFPLQQQLYFH